MAYLEVNDLSRSFGGIQALDSVSFTVEEGTTYVIIGPNGAGKTTLFNCITGYYLPDSGEVRFRGEDITRIPDHKVARNGIRRTWQEVDVFDELTVAENISLGSFVSSPKRVMERFDLLEIFDKQGDELTLWERKRVALALATDGELLLIDEAFSGLNPSEKPHMIEYLEDMMTEKTLMLIEHDIETAFALADSVLVLDQGQVVGIGPPDEISNDAEIQERFLGEMAI